MNNLANLQGALQAHLLNGDTTIASALRPGGIGIERRLAIYRQGYRLRLLAALKDSFGHTLRWLGDEHFDPLALAYIDAHASTSRSLNDYGAGWPAALETSCAEQPAVAELARLDWALRRAFDGADSPVLQRTQLAALPPEAWGHIGFTLVPTFTWLQHHFNTLAIWSALDQDDTQPMAAPLAQPSEVIVWRKGHQPHFRSVGALEAQALRQLEAGDGFAALCARLAEQGQDAAPMAGAWLQQWVDDELLAGMTGG